MTSLDAIGISAKAGAPRGEDPPVVRVQEPEKEKPVEKKSEEAVDRPQAKPAATPPARNVHARLNYDDESEEVIVEILDPQTGDVIQRFPAEELPDDVRAAVGGEAGSLIETIA